MIEEIVLGAIQGATEWLPLSSEGMVILAKTWFFGGGSLDEMVRLALFLHMGTFFAALAYFRKEAKEATMALLAYRKAGAESKKLLSFLLAATLVSGVVATSVFFRERLDRWRVAGLVLGVAILVLAVWRDQLAAGGAPS
jgi:undecaprenyl-diphosphatase